MRLRRWARQRGVHRVGVLALILGLVHAPLPQPDYHNIRHHDGPGEVCEHHDHLLRWHPQARASEDIAVLHWHWLLPLSERPEAPARGPAWHAHLDDWDAGLSTDDAPRLASPPVSPIERPAPSPVLGFVPDVPTAPPRPLSTHPPLAFSATFAPHASLTSLLQRWAC